jgi:hypothetical protein
MFIYKENLSCFSNIFGFSKIKKTLKQAKEKKQSQQILKKQ